jgi:exopolysaccharide biosynthesis polyprenyl glycosylphosphotransferase
MTSSSPLDVTGTALPDNQLVRELVARRRAQASMSRRRGQLMRRILIAADVIGLSCAFLLVELIAPAPGAGRWALRAEVLLFVVMLPTWVVLAGVHGLYNRDEERTDHSTADDLIGVLQLVTIGLWLFFVGSSLTGIASPSIAKFSVFWVLAIALVTTARGIGRVIGRQNTAYLQNTIVVGAGEVGQSIASKFLHHREYGITLVGFVDDAPRPRSRDLSQIPLLGGVDELDSLVHAYGVERVVFAFSQQPPPRIVELIRSLKDMDVQIDLVPRLFEVLPPGAEVYSVEGMPLIGLPPLRLSRGARILKRAIDVCGSGIGLIMLAPLALPVAIAIKLDSPGPVFFRQLRVGRAGKTFHIFKLRTMATDADARRAELRHLNRHGLRDDRMFKIEDDPRVTRIGRILRRYSLDELPQLINVLRGEMSLVGPRPLVADEAAHVRDWAQKRLDLTPGITGLWQVLGRSAIPFDEMVRLDYSYVTTWSVWRDIKLLLRTIPAVARGAND